YEARPNDDVTSGWISGARQLSDRRMTAITTYATGSIVHRYELAYRDLDETVTRRSLLTSVQSCDRTNVCLAPTVFDWQIGAAGYDDVAMPGENMTNFEPNWVLTTTLDTDADGVDEILFSDHPVYVPRDVDILNAEKHEWKFWDPAQGWWMT